MREELITLTQKEHERLSIIRKVLKRELRQKEAGALMGVTDRQVRNLVRKVKEKGAHGLAHGNRGKPSPRRMPGEVVARIVGIIKDRYRDFKPKFAAEKLWKRDKIKVSDEKLRQIMIEAGLWRVHRRKTAVHQWRERKSYYGEMVQMDGSHHAWLETRGPKLVLMGLVDDARNRFYGRFYEYEGVYPAMNALEGYLRLYGLPQSLYVDKHSTYKTVRDPSEDELLQDRLVKELRLASISSLDAANRFLESYLPRFNAQFEREALRPGDLHRPLRKSLNLEEIFCLKATRTIHNGCFVRWKGKRYAIEDASRRMKGRPVLILDHFDGRMRVRFEGRDLKSGKIHVARKRKYSCCLDKISQGN